MSKELERIERIAQATSITDRDEIDNIVNDLLDLKLRPNREIKGDPAQYLINDIAEGFVLDNKKVAECSIRELLILIGVEPMIPWCRLPEEDTCFRKRKLGNWFCSAWHNGVLATYLRDSQKTVPTVTSFFLINFRAFTEYLAERVHHMQDMDKEGTHRKYMRLGMRLNAVYHRTVSYMEECTPTPEYSEESLSIGDIVMKALQRGKSPWACGTEPVDHYVDKVISSYEVLNMFFIIGIRNILIDEDSVVLDDLLDRCSEGGVCKWRREASGA